MRGGAGRRSSPTASGLLEGTGPTTVLHRPKGPSAAYVLSGGEGGRDALARVGAARGLLQPGDATGRSSRQRLDEAWRVREMAAKVIARHQVGDALPTVAALTHDPVPRVRSAAERAVMILAAARA